MAISYGFFNSVDGDRIYNADDFNNCIDAIASDGVFKRNGGALQVVLNTGLSVQILDGYARFAGYWVHNDAFVNMDITTPSTSYARIDAVVVRVNITARTAEFAIKAGTPAETPIAPEMTRTDDVKEYCLALVNVPANATQISQSNITDTRGDNTVCGWVKCGALARYIQTTTISESTTTLNINIPEYENGDVLDVYRGGMYLINGVDYTISSGVITFTSAISSGTICIVVTKQTF